jgi:hypothetical protein
LAFQVQFIIGVKGRVKFRENGFDIESAAPPFFQKFIYRILLKPNSAVHDYMGNPAGLFPCIKRLRMNAEKAAHLFRGKQPFSQIITSIKAGPGRRGEKKPRPIMRCGVGRPPNNRLRPFCLSKDISSSVLWDS